MNKSDILKTVKSNIENEDIINNVESDSENEGENIIIQNFSIGGDKRVEVSSMLSTVLAQREVDQRKFLNLNKKNSELEIENSKLDMKLHYMKLDLANAEIKVEELQGNKKALEISCKELEDLRKTLPTLQMKSYILNLIMILFFIFSCFMIVVIN
jgi:hypothetical protein